MDAAAVDSMIIDYLVQAMGEGYSPHADPDQLLATQRVAAFRLFLWDNVTVLPTVLSQLKATKDVSWRHRLERLVLVHLPEKQIPTAAQPSIQARAICLGTYHRDSLDCQIVAEAEWIRAAALLSFDHRLRKHLGGHAQVKLLTPSEYWEMLAIPHNTPPHRTPAESNPIAGETWWHW